MAYIKKKSGSAYLITVSCGRDSVGKKITRSVTFTPELLTKTGKQKAETVIEREVKTFAADFERKVLTGQYTEGHTMTFEKYAAKYLAEYAEENQAPRTLQSTESAIKEFISSFGYMTLENLTPLYLQEYVNALLKRKKADGSGETLSCGTVKRKAAVLSAMLSQAVRWNLITANPMERVQIKAPDTPEDEKIVFFSQPEAEHFLEALENPAYYTASGRLARPLDTTAQRLDDLRANRRSMMQYKFLFYLAIFTGCRRGELVALTWDDLDFTNATISIVKSVCRVKKEIIVKSTKTKKSARLISLPAIVLSRSFFADSSIHALRFLSLLLRLLSFDFSLCIRLAQAGQYFDIPELGTYSTPHTVQFLGFNAVHRFVGVICNSPTKPMNL